MTISLRCIVNALLLSIPLWCVALFAMWLVCGKMFVSQ